MTVMSIVHVVTYDYICVPYTCLSNTIYNILHQSLFSHM